MIIRKEFDFFTVEAIKHANHVDFTIYEGIGYLEAYAEDIKLGFDPELGPNYDDDPLMTGYIRWDGCSNWDFPALQEGHTHPLHFCSQQESKCFGELFPEVYKWAAELMPDNKHMILDK